MDIKASNHTCIYTLAYVHMYVCGTFKRTTKLVDQ